MSEITTGGAGGSTDEAVEHECLPLVAICEAEIERLMAEVARLEAEVEFGILKVLRLNTLLSEQAAVHKKREVLLDVSAQNYARSLTNLKAVVAQRDRERAERLGPVPS